MKNWIFILIFLSHQYSHAQETPFEKNGKNYTATYDECIQYYQLLEKQYKGIKIVKENKTDSGYPLHLVLINAENQFEPKIWKTQNKCILLINNGIHPGEPDGIDASMMLARQLVEKIKNHQLSKDICIAIIPVYNIGGMLNRSPFYRVDQNGPEEFGSRGNGQNLDLNRDFIKCDSKEALAFAEIFHKVNPHIFLDNHVSDGADYPYTMTLATSQKDKLGGILADYLTQNLEPAIFESMKRKNWPMIPYVNVWGKDARMGWPQFFDSPRYSSGFATLFNTLAFVPETHMLKPYKDRVEATLALMNSFIEFATEHTKAIVAVKKQAIDNMMAQQVFPIQWSNSKDSFTTFSYNGYSYHSKKSEVSFLPIHFYDKNAPYSAAIPFYNYYPATATVQAPKAYIIPQAWHKVISLLQTNRIEMNYLMSDTELVVQYYHIDSYKSNATPYEGHHGNTQIAITANSKKVKFRTGDVMISTDQIGKRYLIETLEPHAMDSYFSWNFFDAILVQKEGFTDYAYEAIAAEYLKQNPSLRDSLTKKQLADTAFAKDADAQLDFVYKNSPYYEPQHNVYPVYRLMGDNSIPIKSLKGVLDANKKDE